VLSLEIWSKWLKMKWNIMKTFCLGLYYCEMDKTSLISHWSSRLKKEKNNNCRNVAFIQHEKYFWAWSCRGPIWAAAKKTTAQIWFVHLKLHSLIQDFSRRSIETGFLVDLRRILNSWNSDTGYIFINYSGGIQYSESAFNVINIVEENIVFLSW